MSDSNRLPDLNAIFFEVASDDDHDHALDSCCISLARDWIDNAARWTEVRDQHIHAFWVQAEAAINYAAKEQPWLLARPLVFSAHHVTELALKCRTLPSRSRWQDKAQGHSLAHLLELERELYPARSTGDWEDNFVAVLTRADLAGKYPDGNSGDPLFDEWCCISAGALRDAVFAFLQLIDPPQAVVRTA